MKRILAAAALVSFLSSPAGAVPPVEEGRPKPIPAAPAVGYSCVPKPKTGPVKIVMTPPPPGFKCPAGESLFLVTKSLQGQVGAAPATEVDVPGPGPADPVLSGPPGTSQEVRAPKKKKTQRKQCVPVDGALFCCYNGGTSDCRLE